MERDTAKEVRRCKRATRLPLHIDGAVRRVSAAVTSLNAADTVLYGVKHSLGIRAFFFFARANAAWQRKEHVWMNRDCFSILTRKEIKNKSKSISNPAVTNVWVHVHKCYTGKCQ